MSVRFRLNEQSLIYHKQECPATEASSSLTRNSVPKLLPSVAGHYFLRHIELPAVSAELPDMPMPLPMGEVALRSNDGEGKPLGEPFQLHDTAPLRWNKWRSSYKLNDTSLNISCSPTWRSSPDWRSTYFASWAQVRHLGEVCFMALVR